MAETELTKEIKKALLYYTKADQAGVYGCYEVCLGAGYGDEYVDFMTMNSTNVFQAYEIKISLSDLKSKAKLSFAEIIITSFCQQNFIGEKRLKKN